ncbi:MAG: hypothetical protein HWE12_07415 [Oceanospirillaceae bacterium]|nr:hypothetical protein [Oceanospirillaceae bacterium]
MDTSSNLGHQFLLLYCKSAEGFPIGDVPFFSVDDNSNKFLVVSARGSSLEKIFLEQTFYNTHDIWFVLDGENKHMNTHEFYHYWAALSDDVRSQIELSWSSTWHELFHNTKLNRVLVLIALPRAEEHEADQDEVKRYLSSLPDFVERVSVGGDEVVIDYLMTRYLSEIQDPISAEDYREDDYEITLIREMLQDDYGDNRLGSVKSQTILGPSDFSYHCNLEHLEPNEFDIEDDYSYVHVSRNDDFYYRFDHKKIEWLREYLRIPDPIEQILSEEQWGQIREVYIEEIETHIQSIQEGVFGMEPIKRKSAVRYDSSLSDYLGFSGPFSDSELGD